MAISAAEQYLLELINRGRLDPQSDAARFKLDLNAGLASGTINGSARQVLASNADLEKAATVHSGWMLDVDSFSHDGPGGNDAGDRMRQAGYDFDQPGSWAWAENLSYRGGTGGTEGMIQAHYEQLYRSASHREHTFDGKMREVGLSEVMGNYQSSSGSMLTENFGLAGQDVFVTGVAYKDKNTNDFYNIGEGRGGIRLTAEGQGATTAGTGGYSIGVTPDSSVDITVQKAGKAIGALTMDLSQGNGKLDLVQQGNGSWEVALSSSATLQSGISHGTLLGVARLGLTGNEAGNRLTGNDGANLLDGKGGKDTLRGDDGADRLLGGNGNDKLFGDGGKDRLEGQNGNDRLVGGGGNDSLCGGGGKDKLLGGSGADAFVFKSAGDSPVGNKRDTILDFGNGNDRINLSAIDADSTAAGNQNFHFIGAKGFSGEAGELRYSGSGKGLMVEADIDGNGKADMQIFVDQLGHFSAGDFIL